MPSSSIFYRMFPSFLVTSTRSDKLSSGKANYVSMPLMFPSNYLALLDFWQAGETTELQLNLSWDIIHGDKKGFIPIVHCLKFYDPNSRISRHFGAWQELDALCIGKPEHTFLWWFDPFQQKKEIPKTAMTQCHNGKGSGGAGQLLTKSWQKLPGNRDLTNAPLRKLRKSGHVTRIHGLKIGCEMR